MDNTITQIIIVGISVFVSIIGILLYRLISAYDDAIKDIYEKVKDLPAIRTDIEWLKKEWSGKGKNTSE